MVAAWIRVSVLAAAACLAHATPNDVINTTNAGLVLLQLQASGQKPTMRDILSDALKRLVTKGPRYHCAGCPSVDENRGSRDCSACAFVGDLRCNDKSRNEYFHRVNSNLWPQYDVVTASRDSRYGNGTRCYVVDPFTMDVLQPLVKDLNTRFINPKAECVNELRNPQKSLIPGGIFRGLNNDPTDAQRKQLMKNREALGKDASSVAKWHGLKPIAGPYVVLMLRERMRVFQPGSEKMLIERLKGLGKERNFTVVFYNGTESMEETISMFADAAGVVGYHGAGFSNALFGRNACVVEMTTYRDKDYSDQTLARTMNMNKRQYDSKKDNHPAWRGWSIYGVPLRQIIEANDAEKDIGDAYAYRLKDGLVAPSYLVDHMYWVKLTEKDVESVADMLGKCL